MKLYQIVDLLRIRIDNKDILFNDLQEKKLDNKLFELYRGIENGEFKSDEEASIALFGKGTDYTYYFDVKGRFRDQLLKNLFHLNLRTSEFQHYYREELENEIALQQAKILLRVGLRENAIWLYKRILKTAEAYQFTSVMKECYRHLKNHMVYEGNEKKYSEYHNLWMKAAEIENAELEAEDLFAQIRVKSQKSVKELKNTKDKTLKILNRVSELRNKYETPMLIQLHYLMLESYYLRTANWEGTVELANEIMQNSKMFPDKFAAVRIKSVHVSKLYGLIILGRIEEGLEYANIVKEDFRGDEVNYFIFLEDCYLLNMRAGYYEKALEVVESALQSKYFEKVNTISKERWDLYLEYALFYCNIDSKKILHIFNYFPEYSKDKFGFNIQILILQAVALLKQNEYELFFEHLERLRMYEIRQISKADNRRAQYFLRLISQITSHGLNYEKCKKQGNKYFNLLKQFPEKDQPYTEVEIIPYETMWLKILQMLKNATIEENMDLQTELENQK